MACSRIPNLRLTVTYNLRYKIQPASFDTPASVLSGGSSNSFTFPVSNTSWCCLRTFLLNLILYTGTVLWLWPSGSTVIFYSNRVVYNHTRHLHRLLTILLLKNSLSCPLLTCINCTGFVIQCFCVLFNNLSCVETKNKKMA